MLTKKVNLRFCFGIEGVLIASKYSELQHVYLFVASGVLVTTVPVSLVTG